ncbi:MAG: hypothetical protein FJ137_03310 [Deltaproteobacteria bacterium]|nr:hypothetical protein [Deltaproteobacteria bacterium]
MARRSRLRRIGRAARFAPGLLVIVLAGCTFDTTLTGDEFIRCGDDRACPLGSVCIVALQRCIATSSCVIGEGANVTTAADGAGCGEGSICVQGACVDERCGDGFVADSEECDEGAANSDLAPESCRLDCVRAHCGDGVVDADETCDGGAANSDVAPDACRLDCTPARCGDGVIDGAEVCDDGNVVSGDGCRGTCDKVEVCGDGFVDEGEQCDDENANNLDLCGACATAVWRPEILAGLGAEGGDPQRVLIGPASVAVDRVGNLYIADILSSTILRLDAVGQKLTRFSGTGTSTSVARPGPAGVRATDVNATGVLSLHVSAAGELITADIDESVVRRIDGVTGRAFDVAGNGLQSSSGDGGPGVLAAVGEPRDVATDGNGNVIITDVAGNRVRRVDRTTGIITTIAGEGRPSAPNPAENGDGGDPLRARVTPRAVDVDALGNVWVWEARNILRKLVIDPSDRSRFLRIEQAIVFPESGDTMESVAVSADGRTAWVTNRTRHQVFEFDLDALTQRPIAGTGTAGFDGDGPDATLVQLNRPAEVVVFDEDTLFIADLENGRVRRLDRNPDGTWAITTVAGVGLPPDVGFVGYFAPRVLQVGGGGLGLKPRFECPNKVDVALAQAALRQVFFQDACTGSFRLIAGTGGRGSTGDGGPALQATFVAPRGTTVDAFGNVYVADPGAHVVRRISVDGVITLVAGTGVPGATGDGGPATAARLNRPASVAVDDRGRVVIADAGNHRLRRVDLATGIITTLLGTGVALPGLDGTNLATQTVAEPVAVLFLPATLLQDGASGGLLFFVERTGHRVRALADVTIPGVPALLLPVQTMTLAGDGSAGYIDDVDGLAARFDHPRALGGFVDESCPSGCVLVLDGIDRVRRLNISLGQGARIVASVTTDVGGALATDDGPLSSALLPGPAALASFGESSAVVVDRVTGRLRRVDLAAARIDTVAGLPEGLVPDRAPTSALLTRPFDDPSGLAVDETTSPRAIYVAERGEHVIRRVVAVDDANPSTWTTEDVCGQRGTAGHVDGACDDARFFAPAGLALAPERGFLFVADQENHVIRRIDLAARRVVTIAGQVGVRGVLVDDVAGRDALLDTPSSVEVVGDALFVADAGAHRVVRIEAPFADDLAQTRVHAVLGDGVAASSGEGRPAAFFNVDTPESLAADGANNLFVASQQVVRFVAAGDDHADGQDSVVSIYGAPPRARFPEPVTKCINGVTRLPAGDVLAIDRCVGLLLRLRRTTP